MTWKRKRGGIHSNGDLYIIKRIGFKKYRLYCYDEFDEEYINPYRDFNSIAEAKNAALFDYLYPYPAAY